MHDPAFVGGAEDGSGHPGAVDRGAGGAAFAVGFVGRKQRLAVEVQSGAVGAVNAHQALDWKTPAEVYWAGVQERAIHLKQLA